MNIRFTLLIFIAFFSAMPLFGHGNAADHAVYGNVYATGKDPDLIDISYSCAAPTPQISDLKPLPDAKPGAPGGGISRNVANSTCRTPP